MFVVTQDNPASPRPYTAYLSQSGFITYRLDSAATFRTEQEAIDERDWFAATYPARTWQVEKV